MLGKFGPIARTSLGAVMAVLLLATVNIPEAAGAPGFASGYTAVPASFNAQPQWQRIMASAAARPGAAPWQELVSAYDDAHPLRQLDAVNRYFNRIPYAEDRANYGVNDHWATPEEFVRRNVGDCEDYAIAKYTALRALGWSADSLIVVVIRDHKHNVNHAALAARLDGQWYYLDNRASRLMTPAELHFYQPVYALNERELSVFIKQPPTQEAAVTTPQRAAQKAHSG